MEIRLHLLEVGNSANDKCPDYLKSLGLWFRSNIGLLRSHHVSARCLRSVAARGSLKDVCVRFLMRPLNLRQPGILILSFSVYKLALHSFPIFTALQGAFFNVVLQRNSCALMLFPWRSCMCDVHFPLFATVVWSLLLPISGHLVSSSFVHLHHLEMVCSGDDLARVLVAQTWSSLFVGVFITLWSFLLAAVLVSWGPFFLVSQVSYNGRMHWRQI